MTDYDAMSDEEFALQELDFGEEVEEEEVSDDPAGEETKAEERDTSDSEELDTNAEEEEEADDSEDEEADQVDDDNADTDNQDADTETEQESSETNDIDYEADYKSIMEPFKANGKQMTVETVKDAKQLMSMGAGFSHRMKQIKPYLKLIKTLEANDLLDADKVNHLIDLSKKDPKAIAKLMKDGDIDPLDVDVDSAEDYEPKKHQISDEQYDLGEVLDEIREDENFDRTVKLLGEDWDAESQAVVKKNPVIVKVINDHMQDGTFEKVQAVVDRERTMGRLEGVSDQKAYLNVYEQLSKEAKTIGKSDPLGDEVRKKASAKAKAKKKAASPTKRGIKRKISDDELSELNDEDFLAKFG